MSEIKRGTTVTVPGVVVCEAEDQRLVELPNGGQEWFVTTSLTVQPEPAVKVGDRVKVQGVASPGAVKHITPAREAVCRVVHDTGEVVSGDYPHSRLTVIPPEPEPEPTYHVEYKDDTLRLFPAGGRQIDYVPMSNPPGVYAVIDRWAHDYGIDADEVRELIAVPTVIATIKPLLIVRCSAIRHATGWYARMSTVHHNDSEMTASLGKVLDEDAGRGHFPGIEGPYEQQ